MPSGRTVRAFLAPFLLSVFAPGVVAQESLESFTASITAELRERNPQAADLFVAANAARANGDAAAAESLYREVRDLEPTFYHATRRLCGVILQQDRRDEALALCREAFDEAATGENRAALIGALISSSSGTPPSQADRREALKHAKVLLQSSDSDENELVSTCEAAAVGKALDMLRDCARRLEAVTQRPELVFYANWLVEMTEGDLDAARSLLYAARAKGTISPQVYDQLIPMTSEGSVPFSNWLRPAGIGGGLWLGGLALLLAVGAVLSHLTLRAARRIPTADRGRPVGLAAGLRRVYRTVIWLCCAYYYISIPLLVIGVTAVGAGLIYALLQAERVSIRLLVIITAIVLVTVWSALKSLFVRAKDIDPGDRLDTDAHPRLRRVLEEVAQEIGTRPVDRVYLTPGTELAVMERGGMVRQLRGTSERCLILGVGVLEGMTLGSFKAILAHEYGHFSNRDTAGGGFALAVRRSLLSMAEGLARGGAATWYSPAWLFLNGFYRVFLRVSQGASRLQEILADRWAALAYGAEQFARGLSHVIDRSVRFSAYAQVALKEHIDSGHALVNLYSYRPDATLEERDLRQAVEAALTAEPSPYESHPSPVDRIRWARVLEATPTGDLSDADNAVWDLFSNRAELELRMTDRVREHVRAQHEASRAASAALEQDE